MVTALINTLEGLGSPKVFVIGDLILDKYVWGEATRISPEAPTPVVQFAEEESRAGGAGNVVSALAGLGAEVSCCGVVGDDADGAFLVELIEKNAAGKVQVIADPDRPTSVKTRFGGYVQSALRGMQHMLRVDKEDSGPISDAMADQVCAFLEDALVDQDALIIEDYNKGLLTPRVVECAIRKGREAGIPVIVDPRRDADYSLYRGATLITPNRYETQLATGIAIRTEDDMLAAAKKLQRELDLKAVALTLDRDGMYLYEAEAEERAFFRAETREVYDITGAGDMVVSVFAVLLGAGAAYRAATDLANVAAGIEVTKVGVAQVSREEIIGKLYAREHGVTSKLKTLEQLLPLLEEHRRRGDRIVFTNGCFDILHIGHIEYLKFARRQGDLLVVGMNSDESIRELKGPKRPILHEEDRAGMLAGLEDVDYVTIFSDPSVEPLVRQVRPDVLVKGEDWRGKGVVGQEFVESYGGEVILAPVVEGISTTDIVSRILERYADEIAGQTDA